MRSYANGNNYVVRANGGHANTTMEKSGGTHFELLILFARAAIKHF